MSAFATLATLILFQNNTQEVLLQGLRDNNGNFVNNAVLNMQVLDQNRNIVVGSSPMVYVSASNGDYSGVINVPFESQVGAGYWVLIDGDQFTTHLHLEVPAQVVVRTF